MSMRVVFSKQLLDYRTANHLTQYQMAEMCGLSVRRYQELEQGHSLPLLLRPCAWPQFSISVWTL